MRSILLITLAICAYNLTFGQSKVKFLLPETKGSFTAIAPPSQSKGMIVFLPGFTQTSESLLEETSFPQLAYLYGLVTIIVPCGPKIYADKEVVALLNEAIDSAMTKYQIPADKVVIGGFSAGGTIALRYAAYCHQYPDDYPAQPQTVFTVDSPVDLFQIYKYLENEIQKNYSEAGVNEAVFVKKMMLKELGGSPEEKPETYKELSPYSYGKPDGGNIKWLKQIPVRAYHDADVNWQLTNRRRSLMDMNVTPASAMINDLLLLGNEQAELMMTVGTGKRSDGTVHPHSMSIMDDQEMILWVLQHLKIPANKSVNR